MPKKNTTKKKKISCKLRNQSFLCCCLILNVASSKQYKSILNIYSFKIYIRICTPLDMLSKGVFLCRKRTSKIGKWIEPYRLNFHFIRFGFIYLNFSLIF